MADFFLTKTRYLTILVVALVIVIRWDLESIFGAVGGIICGIMAKLLKMIIKQPRPHQIEPKILSVVDLFTTSKDYGMPSSHTQILAYFATYSYFYIQSWVVIGLISIAVFTTAASRVYYEYHTRNQVLVGLGLGFGFASLWYKIAKVLLNH